MTERNSTPATRRAVHRRMAAPFGLLLAAVLIFGPLSPATARAEMDVGLNCYKVRDPVRLGGFAPLQLRTSFGGEECRLRRGAYLCTDDDMEALCYRAHCKGADLPRTIAVEDDVAPSGRELKLRRSRLLCLAATASPATCGNGLLDEGEECDPLSAGGPCAGACGLDCHCIGHCNGVPATILGTAGADEIYGTEGNDVIQAGGGNDIVFAGGGDDVVCGGRGHDQVHGEEGRDVVLGGPGDDTLSGGDGDDALMGGAGSDAVFGGEGDDVVSGGRGRDALHGGVGADQMEGGDGDDLLVGDASEGDSCDCGDGIDSSSAGCWSETSDCENVL